MEFLSIFGRSKPVQPAPDNNSWQDSYRASSTVFVFVHGVLSSPGACWFQPKTGAFWPKLVRADAIFGGAPVFLAGYYTQVDAGEYGIRDCARELLEGLSRSYGSDPAVLDHERLVFVCHSLGGIVTRYMLECWRELFEQKAILLVLVASPSVGSQWANSLEGVLALFRNRTGRELRWKSDSLDDLDRRFKEMRGRNLIPRLAGCEWCEQTFPRTAHLFGVPPIVAVDSAARYFDDHHLIPGSDHLNIVKPPDDRAPVHLLLRDAYQRFDKTYPSVLPPPAPSVEIGRAAAPDLFQCERMSLALRIYDDGDGHNQFAFEDIRAVRCEEGAVYKLREQWVGAGQATPYLLQLGGSSPGLSLRTDKKAVCFDPVPSAERPQRLLLESLAAHSFAMDKKELAEGDLDYAQMTVRWETIRELVMEIGFPDEMSLAPEPPFIYAYQLFPAGGEDREVFDSGLTRRAAEGFSYSPLLRTVFLRVRNPPQRTAYRIYWRLGEPLIPVDPPTPWQRALLETRRTELLKIRECFAASGPGMANRKERVLSHLTDVGERVVAALQTAVAKTPADKAALRKLIPHIEVTLMAMEAAGENHLRFVAGTAVAEPGFWDLKMDVGEGIAGRAAKWLDAKVYDDEEVRGTVFAGVYKELKEGRRHAWLLAIPLWSEECGRAAIGVLNIGTFDSSGAWILRALGQPAPIEDLAEWANHELLAMLFEVVSSNQGDPKP